MKTKLFFTVLASILIAALLPCGSALAWYHPLSSRIMDPIVSTDWLNDNSSKVVIIDIRSPGDYGAGHIPGAINEPFVTGFDPFTGPSSNWIIGSDDGLWLEVPDDDDLFATIGNLGITSDSWVVIVTAPNPDEPPFYGLANGTRVAATLIYAGVKNVAILNGGYPKWVAGGNESTDDVPVVEPVRYRGTVNKGMFVSISYVRRHLWRADIIDARDADVYFGATIEPLAPVEGHIPGAASLPAPWIWDLNIDGTYTFKAPETLGAMAAGVPGDPRHHRGWGHKTIVYCGVGGYASSWWFVLTQVLGYHQVKFYDGSAQEWVMEGYEMVPFQWD
jgi:thiosulfate/3-mercaptopyruvate sulfurtransferase